MLCSVTKVDNGFIIRRYSGRSDYNKCIGEWVAKDPEEVIEKIREILKEKDD